MTPDRIPDIEAARALVKVLGDARWEAVGIARGYVALKWATAD